MRCNVDIARALALGLAAGLMIGGAGFAAANPNPPDGGTAPPANPADSTPSVDDLPNPKEDKRRELRERALEMVLSGEAKAVRKNGSTVVKIGTQEGRFHQGRTRPDQVRSEGQGAHGRPVRRAGAREDRPDLRRADRVRQPSRDTPRYGDQDTDPDTPGPVRFDGPLHNADPRTRSSGRQLDDLAGRLQRGPLPEAVLRSRRGCGVVQDLLREAVLRAVHGRRAGHRLGQGAVQRGPATAAATASRCASNVCSNTWDLIRDGIDQWVAEPEGRRPDGRTDQGRIWPSYDNWDRYDFDGDGNFNEADGYVDHFQIVHSGGDQADGDPYQGEDAIWSHRWKAYQCTSQATWPVRPETPTVERPIGATGLWVADYTIQPENGGLSVFAHEYGHDLGLPDLYDTSGVGSDNAVGFVEPDGSEPAVGAPGPGHRHPGRRPRRLGKAPTGLARLRDRAGRPAATPIELGSARIQQLQGPGPRRRAAQEAGDHRAGGPLRRIQDSGGAEQATIAMRP